MKYYLIDYENGVYRHGYFKSYCDAFDYALDYAESHNLGCDFTISEYDSEEDFYDNW